jgi:hypothetical protein
MTKQDALAFHAKETRLSWNRHLFRKYTSFKNGSLPKDSVEA